MLEILGMIFLLFFIIFIIVLIYFYRFKILEFLGDVEPKDVKLIFSLFILLFFEIPIVAYMEREGGYYVAHILLTIIFMLITINILFLFEKLRKKESPSNLNNVFFALGLMQVAVMMTMANIDNVSFWLRLLGNIGCLSLPSYFIYQVSKKNFFY